MLHLRHVCLEEVSVRRLWRRFIASACQNRSASPLAAPRKGCFVWIVVSMPTIIDHPNCMPVLRGTAGGLGVRRGTDCFESVHGTNFKHGFTFQALSDMLVEATSPGWQLAADGPYRRKPRCYRSTGAASRKPDVKQVPLLKLSAPAKSLCW